MHYLNFCLFFGLCAVIFGLITQNASTRHWFYGMQTSWYKKRISEPQLQKRGFVPTIALAILAIYFLIKALQQ
jgi:hypothetical protein